MRPRQFDLIAFDWDGTLFDSTAIIVRSIQAAVADVGGRVPDDRSASYVIGMGLMQALAHAAPDVPPERYPLLGERYRHHYLSRQTDISLFDGVLPMLRMLRERHHWLTVATGKSRRGLDHCLAMHGLSAHFCTLQTADHHPSKPHPAMVETALAESGADRDATVMIGDTQFDMAMAVNAGVRAIGVDWGYHTADELRDAGAEAIARNPAHLMELLS